MYTGDNPFTMSGIGWRTSTIPGMARHRSTTTDRRLAAGILRHLVAVLDWPSHRAAHVQGQADQLDPPKPKETQ